MNAENETIDAELAVATVARSEELPVAIRPGDKPQSLTPGTPRTAAQAKVDAIADLTAAAYHRASQLAMTPEESVKLQADFPDNAFQPGAAGKENLICIEHSALRQRLNEVFGAGQWAIIPRSRWSEDYRTPGGKEAVRVYVEAMLLVRGCFVAEAVGDMSYYRSNDSQNYGDAVEGAKTAALRRCCKELGIGLQAWSKDWCNGWWQRRKGTATASRTYAPAPQPAAKPTPVTQSQAPAPQPAPAAATPAAAAPKAATPADRERMIVDLKCNDNLSVRQTSEEYFRAVAQLLDGETLEDLPLRFVPTTQQQLRLLVSAIAAFEMGDKAQVAFDPNPEAEDAPKPAKEKPAQREAGDRIEATIESIAKKEGTKNGKAWCRYGIKAGGEWYNTFDSKLAERAEELKGQAVTIEYKSTQFGKDLVEILTDLIP